MSAARDAIFENQAMACEELESALDAHASRQKPRAPAPGLTAQPVFVKGWILELWDRLRVNWRQRP